MIEGAPFKGCDALTSGHDEEQQCLFFVALSRAEERLILYAYSKRSKFVDDISGHVLNESPQSASAEGAVSTNGIKLEVDGIARISPSELATYEKCPRRFFFAHVLQVGGRRAESPLMRMHNAVQVS